MESNVFLQPGQMRDIGTLQSSTHNILFLARLRAESLSFFPTVSESVAFSVYIIADVWALQCPFTKDLSAMHGAVGAVAMIAVALFRARGPILKVDIFRARGDAPQAVLGQVTDVLDGSAQCPRRGVGAVCAAPAFIAGAARGQAAVAVAARVAVTVLEGAAVTLLALVHVVVSTVRD